MKIYGAVTELIGQTPLLRLSGFMRENSLNTEICAKLEYLNPAGSVKDRVALAMINDAEESGKLRPGSVIIEPTSGNTGIGLAAIASARGYEVILTMPETMSVERRKLLAAYSAKIVLTEGAKGMAGAIERAEQLVAATKNSFMPSQFTNMANPEAHYATTAPEIWRDCDGMIDIFVAGVGTGGTLSGVGRYLKEKNAAVKVVAVEPYTSAVLSGKNAGAHGLQGIGAGFVPETLDTAIYDEVLAVTDEEAYKTCRTLAKTDGLLVGISSGAAVAASLTLAKRSENSGKRIVVLLPDGGVKYLSTPAFDVE